MQDATLSGNYLVFEDTAQNGQETLTAEYRSESFQDTLFHFLNSDTAHGIAEWDEKISDWVPLTDIALLRSHSQLLLGPLSRPIQG